MAATEKFAVAIVGVGNMGAGMATRLLSLGWSLHVHDVDATRMSALAGLGAQPAASAAQAVQQAQALIVCVVDAAQSAEVLFGAQGAAPAMQPGQLVMLCPTLAPEETQALASRLAEHGLLVLDAPMSGGPLRARDGSMSLMVAGADQAFTQYGALLNALSSKVFRISERVGDGARTKLVNNLLAGINLVGAAEALALAQRLGLDPAQTMGVIEQSSGQSWIGSDRMQRALAGDWAPRARMALLEKDTRLAVQAAQGVGFEGPLGLATRDVFAHASAAGLQDLDDAALLTWLQRPT